MKFILSSEKPMKRKNIDLVVKTDGIIMDRFNTNPVMLFNHNDNKVLGTWENIEKKDGKLIGEPIFDEDEFSLSIKNKVEKGSIKGASITIDPLEVEEDAGVYYITKSELIEASIAPLPQNPEALKETVSFNLKSENKIEKLLSMKKEDNKKDKVQVDIEAATEVLKEGEKTEVVDETISLKKELEDLTAKKVELSINVENLQKELQAKENEIVKLNNDLSAKDTKIEALNDKIQAYENEKLDTFLEFAIKEGKISQANKDSFLKLSFEKAKEIIDNLPVGKGSLVNDLASFNKDITNKTYEWYLDNDKEGLIRLSKENPSLYRQLEDAYKNKLK